MRRITLEINGDIKVELDYIVETTEIWIRDKILSEIFNSSLAGKASCINIDENSLYITAERVFCTGDRISVTVSLINNLLCIGDGFGFASTNLTDSEASEFCKVMHFICNEVTPKPYVEPYLVGIVRQKLGY